MSFSFSVAGHAGPGVAPTDEDEGERVKRFAAQVLREGLARGLTVTVHNFSPEKWAPETRHGFATSGPGATTNY